MTQHRRGGLALGTASVLLALAVAACTVGSGASPSATPNGTSVSASVTIAPSQAPAPSESNSAPSVIVRTLGQGPSDTFALLMSEILERGEYGNCEKTAEGERTTREEDLREYLAGATGVERLIGPHVWLGTLEGLARSVDSGEVVVPSNPDVRVAYLILRVAQGSDFDAPVGSLAAIEVRRLDAPAGTTVPPGTAMWLFTGDLIASHPCKK